MPIEEKKEKKMRKEKGKEEKRKKKREEEVGFGNQASGRPNAERKQLFRESRTDVANGRTVGLTDSPTD